MDLIKKAIINFKCDKICLFSSNISLYTRIRFIFEKYWSIGFNKRKINFLGTPFIYDSRFGPVLLETYKRCWNLIKELIFPMQKPYWILEQMWVSGRSQ